MINEQQEKELYCLSPKDLVKLIITKDDLIGKLKKYKDIVDNFNKASTLLVGSEYFDDPAYTVSTLQDMVRSKSESIMKQVRRRKEVESLVVTKVESLIKEIDESLKREIKNLK